VTETPGDANTRAGGGTSAGGIRNRHGWWSKRSANQKISIAVPLAAVVIAGIFGVINVLLPILFERKEPTKAGRDPNLSLVDVTASDLKDDSALIDVKLLNSGTSVAFVKRAELTLLDRKDIPLCDLQNSVQSSYTYDIDLSSFSSKLPDTVTIPISQVVKGGGVDRFSFRLGEKSGSYPAGIALYRFMLKLYYNEGNTNQETSDPFLAAVSHPVKVVAAFSGGLDDESYRDCWKDNISSVRYMIALPGYKSTELKNLGEDYERAAEEIRNWERNH
jgi:hypothetical protein